MPRRRNVSERHRAAARIGAAKRWGDRRQVNAAAVRELLDQGLKLREIADRLRMPYWTVVDYTRLLRKQLAGVQ